MQEPLHQQAAGFGSPTHTAGCGVCGRGVGTRNAQHARSNQAESRSGPAMAISAFLVCSCLVAGVSALVCSPRTGIHAGRYLAARTQPPTMAVTVDMGCLVEFSPPKSGPPALGAVTGTITNKAGKTQYQITTSTGKVATIVPRGIRHVVPGSSGGQEAIARHEAAAEQHNALEMEILEETWEMALDEAALPVEELSDLLLGSATSEACWATYRLLSQGPGRAFFKADKEGASFTARSVDESNALRAQVEAEAAAAAEDAALRERVRAAETGGAAFDLSAESQSVREEFEALVRLACRARVDDKDDVAEAGDGMARALLQRLGRKATAESGRSLLVALGVWSVHENLELIRRRVPLEFDEALIEEAARLITTPPEDDDAARRRDLTGLIALAIDEASTVEV